MQKSVYEFISKTNNDPIVERKICTISWNEFAVFQSDLDFYKKISPTIAGEKYFIPTPTLCPEERRRRRLLWRNERKLYRRKCALTGKSMISIYSEDHPYTVYDEKARRGDERDPLEYGKDRNPNRSFFDQFDELMKEVPCANVKNLNNENSEYVNYLNDSKNCYLDFWSGFLEDCCYCNWTYYGTKLFDCGYCFRGENSYMCIKCENFYHCFYCQESKDISESRYCYDCENCNFCVGCVGLRGKNYCILNEQYTKEEYKEKIKEIWNIQKQYKILKNNYARSAMNIANWEKASGNDIKNAKNAIVCYEIDDAQDCKYCTEIFEGKDCMDVDNYGMFELFYEVAGFGYSSRLMGTLYSGNCHNSFYSADCQYCNHVFGCVSLKHKEYCIFNKQYTKEKYEELVSKIIEKMQTNGERGEFSPARINHFGYNETVAYEYFPLTKEEALAQWYKRQDKEYPINVPDGITIIEWSKVNEIKLDNEILKAAIKCEETGKLFRIVQIELDFYRKNNLPLPSKHQDVRHAERIAARPPRALFVRKCSNCEIETLSVYAEESNIKIRCNTCYTQEVYW